MNTSEVTIVLVRNNKNNEVMGELVYESITDTWCFKQSNDVKLTFWQKRKIKKMIKEIETWND